MSTLTGAETHSERLLRREGMTFFTLLSSLLPGTQQECLMLQQELWVLGPEFRIGKVLSLYSLMTVMSSFQSWIADLQTAFVWEEINCLSQITNRALFESNVIPNNIRCLEKRQREVTFFENLLNIKYFINIFFSSCNHQNNTMLTDEKIKD